MTSDFVKDFEAGVTDFNKDDSKLFFGEGENLTCKDAAFKRDLITTFNKRDNANVNDN